jgi:hypothetical protein
MPELMQEYAQDHVSACAPSDASLSLARMALRVANGNAVTAWMALSDVPPQDLDASAHETHRHAMDLLVDFYATPDERRRILAGAM